MPSPEFDPETRPHAPKAGSEYGGPECRLVPLVEISCVDYSARVPPHSVLRVVRPITPPGPICERPDAPFALKTADPKFDPAAPVTINGFRYIPDDSRR